MIPPWEMRSPRAWWGTILLIALLGLALRMWLVQQPVNSDDVHYFQLAHSHNIDPTNTHGMRFMMLGLARFWITLLGMEESAFFAAIYTIPLLSILGLALLARALAEPAVGIVAALLWATSFIFLSSETLFVPDSYGTALINLSVVALLLATRAGVPTPARSHGLALTAGLLFWAACSVRESFIIAFPVLLAVLALGDPGRRGKALPWLGLGLLLGTLLELALLQWLVGDPLVRVKTLLLYPEQVAESTLFQLPTWFDFFVRYPRMLYYTQSAELLLFLAGWAGVGLWLVRRRREDRIKLALWGVTFFFIAFALVRLDPPTPLMRALVRYYVTALPIFYLAAGELAVALWRIDRGGWTPWLRSLTVGFLAVTMAWNLLAFARSPLPARNGKDAYLVLPRVIREDQAASGVRQQIFTHRGTTRILRLYFAPEAGWGLTGLTKKFDPARGFDGGGYLLLDMRKFFGIEPLRRKSERVHPYLTMVERYPVVMRHHHGELVTDLLRLEDPPVQREIRALPALSDAGWRQGTATAMQPLAAGAGLTLAPGKRLAWGEETAPALAVPGDHLVEVIFTVQTRPGQVARSNATLLRWPERGGGAVAQPLGVFGADDQASEVVLWSYLPEGVRGLGVHFEHREGGELVVEAPRMRRMTRHGRDRLEQRGGAW